MAVQSSFMTMAGLGQRWVALSFVAANPPTTIRDAKSGIVATVVRTAQGVYTVTFSELMGKMVAGIAGLNTVDTSPTDIVCSCLYTEASKTLAIVTNAVATPTDPEASSRLSFIGSFWVKSADDES